MRAVDVFEELGRCIAPFDLQKIDNALTDQPSQFDADARWHTHTDGWPHTTADRVAFDGNALVAGTIAVCMLGAYLPVGDPRRLGVPKLHAKILARLANPELMLFAGSKLTEITGKPYIPPGYQSQPQHHGVDNGAIVTAHGYVYFRPARCTSPEDIARVRDAAELHYPQSTFPWSGLYHPWHALTSPGVAALVKRAAESPLAAGQSELDPRLSVPKLVDAAMAKHALDRDAATLYLQTLALVDCSDVSIRDINGWTQTTAKKAIAKLVSSKLAEERKELRANRKLQLPGTWEKLFPPHPAVEASKLPLYDAKMVGPALAAPLGRVVPLRPIHEIFEAAWAAHTA